MNLAPLADNPATTTVTDEITEREDGPVAHIVKTRPGESGTAAVLRARIEGTPLEALCGHVWVPEKDPAQLPVCQKCREVYDIYRSANDGLSDTPRA